MTKRTMMSQQGRTLMSSAPWRGKSRVISIPIDRLCSTKALVCLCEGTLFDTKRKYEVLYFDGKGMTK